MAKSKITATYEEDIHGKTVLRLRRKRGKISVSEIEEFLMYESKLYGFYAIVLRCTESYVGASGWFDELDDPGDVVDLYPIEDGDNCPVCGRNVVMCCPECGTEIGGI